jgi:glycosyltransferase involved in cell wall biosynthesis
MYPKISIITVCLNSEKTIEETIKSVVNQSYKNIEYIIIDGNSTDGTLKILEKYRDKIHKVISEKDDGIYFAFNKGINFVNGEMFGFVNSDDILMPNAIEILVKYLKKYPDIDMVFGSVRKHWGILSGYKPWKINYTWNFYSSHSTGFYIKTDSAKKIGPYNTKYKFASDWEYLFRAIKKFKLKGVATKKNELFGIFRRGGFSSRIDPIELFFETTRIRLEHKQNKLVVFFISILKLARFLFYYKK